MSSTESLKPSVSADQQLMKHILSAARPKTLPASVSPVILGLALAWNQTQHFDIAVGVITLLCALLLQISSNFINDYFDFKSGVDHQQRLGPVRATSAGLVTPSQMKKAFLFTMSLAFVLGIFLMKTGGTPIIIIGISSLLGAYLYTGGPFPLSHMALGEVAAFIFFGPVAVWGTTYLQTKQMDMLPAYVGMIPGFFSAAIMSINNLRDRDSDAQTKKTTVMTLLNEQQSRFLVGVLLLAPVFTGLVLSVRFDRAYALTFIALITLRPSMMFVLKEKIDQRLNLHLAMTGKGLFLASLAMSLGLLFL